MDDSTGREETEPAVVRVAPCRTRDDEVAVDEGVGVGVGVGVDVSTSFSVVISFV